MDQQVAQRLEKISAVRAHNPKDDYDQPELDNDQDHAAAMFKLIIIGDTGVGKSCILTKLTKEEFRGEHNVTIGVEFGNYAMIINDEALIKLQIWDTAGQESFRSITRIFYKGSHAVMLVFDITCRSSFDNIRDWQKEIENNAEEGVLMYLVGNFADCEDNRKVSRDEALDMCKELNFHNYIETSAFTGLNINSLFETLAKHLYIENEANLNEFVRN